MGVILRNGFVLSCDFMYLVYVICLGRLFIGDWRRRHVGSKSYKEGGLQGEGKRITDLVIESGDLIGDRRHSRKPKHW